MSGISVDNFGSANSLNCPELRPARGRSMFGKYDPAEMRKAIGVLELSGSIFPTVQTGVRFWPYLLVAHELRDERNKAVVEKKLRAIHRRQRDYQKQGLYTREFGPTRISTFNAYRSLYKKVISAQEKKLSNLQALLRTRLRYRGSPKFFTDHATEWRKALRVSMARPGREFAKLLDHLSKNQDDSSVVDRALTALLKRTKYDSMLRRGAFCYAFLRCVYGIASRVEGIPSFIPVTDWAKLLSRVLAQPSRDFKPYRRFLPLVQASVEKPALEQLHRRTRAENGIVLAGLGFHVFYNLYIAHTPAGTK
ncbi:MAG TPA: hypothetical protein VFB33_00015 [Candidatus Binataceae bacterium]|nr:hypothetical protein [Candidatus Binataceae bacterium]